MNNRHRLIARKAVGVLFLALIAGWVVPSFFRADRYRRRLERGLEQALHRPVNFGATGFRLLPRPGFSIENVVVQEDPSFGSEPFAHVERIECDLRWRSLWRSRLDFARLRLEQASLNVVRNRQGQWNVERLLEQSAIATVPLSGPGKESRPQGDLVIEAEDARVNLKVADNKKPFAITELRARLEFHPARRAFTYRLVGNPVRADLPLPTPGPVELSGEWTPGRELEGPLEATLRTHGALFYDWVPLVTGHNPEIYGVLDAEVHLAGSLQALKAEGELRLDQLHRWDQLPPSEPLPVTIHFRGAFDRRLGRVLLESVEATVAGSQFHLTGAVEQIASSPEMDLVIAVERSRLEDLASLGQHLLGKSTEFGISGRVDGLISIRGAWTQRRYAGFLTAQDLSLKTPSGTFPASDAVVRISDGGARLAPVRVTLAPHVELMAEAVLERAPQQNTKRENAGPRRYEVVISAKGIPLHDFLHFARAMGVKAAQNIDAQGIGTATFTLAGTAWPLTRPMFAGQAEVRAVRLVVPGLTEPVNFPRARLQFNADQVTADPLVAVMGTSVFSGRIEHRGERKEPWQFDLRANKLSVEEGAAWFDSLGLRRPLPWFERLPGLSSFSARRAAASNVFSALNARGWFSTPSITYRALALHDFRAWVEISGRTVRVTRAAVRAGGSRGQGTLLVDLTNTPAVVTVDVKLAGGSLQSLSARLPPALRRLRGSFSGTGHFETRGLRREEISAKLRGRATVQLRNVALSDFDPLEALARAAGGGSLEPMGGPVRVRALDCILRVGDGQVVLEPTLLGIAGAKVQVAGTYTFGGAVDLGIRADLRSLRRRWIEADDGTRFATRVVRLHLAGPLNRLAVVPSVEVSQADR